MATAARSRHGLATYRAKRDFSKTPEPSGKKASAAGHTYLIQKHAARRLHYDFRLQMGGVLKSWAVTRGPSLDPEDKRLAVHVEDHPLAYGGFEGIIPQDEYGGGTVMLWDKGSWAPVGDPEYGYRKGHLSFELKGERLKGRWHLVRMRKAERGKKENWLLIKGKDKYANTRDGDYALGHFQRSVTTGRSMEQIATGRSRRWSSKSGEDPAPKARAKKTPASKKKKKSGRSRLPAFVKPELATLAKQPPRGDGWLHEIKFDGYRLIARVQDGEVRLLTRDENDWTDRYGPIARALAKLPHDTILDGEVVFQREDGSMSFHELQNASSAEKQAHLHYYAFDLLFLDGEDWRDRPLLERKERLQDLLRRAPENIHYSEHFQAPGDEVLAHACHIALEGIVSKRADRPYRSGRGLDWIKSKCIHEQEIVIGGYTKQAKGGSMLASLLTGYYEGGKLIYSGKVGTGFTQDEARKLLRKLEALGRDKAPFVAVPGEARRGAYWVKPELVAQVNFGEWTPEGRMRHPSFQGLREDKPAREVVREKEQRPPPPKRAAARGKPGARRRTKVEPAAIEGVALSHPDKLLYPEAKVTKGILAEYYAKAARLMLPHVAGRPISLLRCPNGVGHACFFQRHAGEGASPHLLPVKVAHHGGGEPYIMIQDVQGLIALVQSGVLEIHVWGSRADDPEHPDRLVFDFDPDPKVKFAEVKRAALEMREVLKELGLKSFLKTTGGKGLHVVVPFQKGPTWDEAKAFSKALSDTFSKSRPGRFTINSRKAERTGKIFIDYLRNGMTASAIAPYSCRARPDATVALPLSWEELPKLKSASAFGIEDALKRLRKDPWRGMDKIRQKLPIESAGRATRRR
jgi:bifunctional non-homologous end joining protein LigD